MRYSDTCTSLCFAGTPRWSLQGRIYGVSQNNDLPAIRGAELAAHAPPDDPQSQMLEQKFSQRVVNPR